MEESLSSHYLNQLQAREKGLDPVAPSTLLCTEEAIQNSHLLLQHSLGQRKGGKVQEEEGGRERVKEKERERKERNTCWSMLCFLANCSASSNCRLAIRRATLVWRMAM